MAASDRLSLEPSSTTLLIISAARPMPRPAPRNPATAPLSRPLPARVRPFFVSEA